MKTLIRLMIIASFLASLASPVAAQTADDYHPFLSDTFNLGIGAFWPKDDWHGKAKFSQAGPMLTVTATW